MRALVFAIGLVLSSPAFAQENVNIPFAPTLPAAFNIEMHTVAQPEGLPVVEQRVSYGVALRGAAPSYEAVLTVVSADGEDPFGFDPAEELIGFPGELAVVLGPAGEPARVANWDVVRRKLQDRNISLEFIAQREPRRAVTLAPPLAMLAMCHNFNLPVGVPETTETASSPSEGVTMTFRTSREIQSINREAGVAQVAHLSRIEAREDGAAADAEPVQVIVTRAECVVDLQSGMARTGTVALTISGRLGGGSTTRMEIAVTPLNRQD